MSPSRTLSSPSRNACMTFSSSSLVKGGGRVWPPPM